jgi:hypothetical protein
MNVQYLVDEKGEKTGALIPIEEYNHLMDLLEELEDIKDFDFRIANPDTTAFDEVNAKLRVQD